MDITQELEGEEIYKDLFDNAHDLIYFAKIDGTLLYVNRSWMQLLGYTQQEIQHQSIFNFIVEKDRERFKAYRERLISEKTDGKQITIELATKGGENLYVEGFVSVKIIKESPQYTRGIFRDISAKIRNENQLKHYFDVLREREYNLQQLLFHAPDAIIVIDRESLIRFWNPKSELVFGYTMEEVTGKPLAELIIPPEYRDAHTKGMARYLATGEAHVLGKTIDITALNKKGDRFFISLTISTAKQQGDISFIAFIRDITQQKMNELELERKRIEIEKSNKELEQFAHVASHDMKEPVRKIKVFTGRLENELEGQITQQGKFYITKVLEAADRLNDMVEGVLNYASINNHFDSFALIDLKKTIKNIESDLELIIQEKKAIISCGKCDAFEGIPFLIYQLFYNLIANSLKFSRIDRPPIISITCQKTRPGPVPDQDKETVFMQITLKDNGIGFNQDNAEKIFNTFTRLHSKSEYEGTGLGLTLCKNIVERHNGKISAFGKEQEGAVFRIMLPETQQEMK